MHLVCDLQVHVSQCLRLAVNKKIFLCRFTLHKRPCLTLFLSGWGLYDPTFENL